MKYELLDHGIDHSQYFQGCGTAHTIYDECATGIGNDPREALDDCLDQIAEQTSSAFVEALERQILADFPAFNDEKTIAANTVDRGENELARIEDLIATLTEDAANETDPAELQAIESQLTEAEDRYTELEDAREMSELWYHISIRYCHPENLDDAHEDDLLDFAEDEGNDIVLRAYAKLKTEAMTHRAAGRIETALQTERLLEHIYNNLPPFMKW